MITLAEQKANRVIWAKALRSGDYKQGRRRLHRLKDNTFCCLGVACDLFFDGEKRTIQQGCWGDVQVYGDTATRLPFSVREKLGLATPMGGFKNDSLMSLNDRGTSFEEIADLLENEPSLWMENL